MTGDLLATVVVPVKDDERIYRLADSLRHQSLPRDRYEVIVVENGSQRFGDLAVASDVLRYLHLPKANSAAARNAGLAAARGRYLLLTDADCVADPSWIERMTAALQEGPASVIGGLIRPYAPKTWTQRHAITIVNGQDRLNYLPALHLPYVAGANAGFVTTRLREVGGFDEDLRSGNDVDVCYKLGLTGSSAAIVPDAVVWHEDRPTVRAHFRRFRFYATYQVLLFAKYKQHSGKRLVLDQYPFRRAAQALLDGPRAMVRLVRGDPGPASRMVLQLIEAAGVLAGEIEGAIRFRQPYL
ncbi:glycosyltransferase [Micromonospora globbae]|uniref:glycosyltransferase n=1 Tax=Micromonospora globbae TaxID=1894969 RepID=UPI0034141B5B